MIYWLLQSTSDHPDLARGIAPAGLLSDGEQVRWAALKTDKRRRDWLLGRWTAKRLIQCYIERQTGLCPPLDALAINAEPSGAPHVAIGDWRLAIGDRPILPRSLIARLQSLSLSISHSGERAFCALVEGSAVPIGADIERIEPRDRRFVEDYFTAAELPHLWRAPAEQYETVITAIWSAKESALKALRLGLSVDTRSVACSIAGPDPACDWADIAFALDRRLLGPAAAPALTGWWRTIDGYVLTVATTAALTGRPPHPVRLSLYEPVREV